MQWSAVQEQCFNTFRPGRLPEDATAKRRADLLGKYDFRPQSRTQLAKLEWSILPKIRRADEVRGPADARCIEVEEFLRYPDKRLPFSAWQQP